MERQLLDALCQGEGAGGRGGEGGMESLKVTDNRPDSGAAVMCEYDAGAGDQVR